MAVVQPGIPESFHVRVKELQSLGLAIELRYEEDRGLVLPRFTYGEEEEELETASPEAEGGTVPAWEPEFERLEEAEPQATSSGDGFEISRLAKPAVEEKEGLGHE